MRVRSYRHRPPSSTRLRRGYGGQVQHPPSPRLRRTGPASAFAKASADRSSIGPRAGATPIRHPERSRGISLLSSAVRTPAPAFAPASAGKPNTALPLAPPSAAHQSSICDHQSPLPLREGLGEGRGTRPPRPSPSYAQGFGGQAPPPPTARAPQQAKGEDLTPARQTPVSVTPYMRCVTGRLPPQQTQLCCRTASQEPRSVRCACATPPA